MSTNKKAGAQTPASEVHESKSLRQPSYINKAALTSNGILDSKQGNDEGDREPIEANKLPNIQRAGQEVLPTTKPKKKFKFTFGSDGYEHAESWLIKGLLPEQAFGIVYGDSGSYKSFCVLDWAACIATGCDWMGGKTTQGTVVYVAAEGATGFRKRVKAWEMEHNRNQPLGQLAILGMPVFLDQDTDVKELVGAIRESVESNGLPAPKLVVFDTLSRCLAQSDENSAKEMNTVIRLCQQVQQQLQVTVILVHHSGKDKDKGARGSSVLRAACDFEYKVSRKSDLTYQLDNTKAKDSESMGKVEITLRSIALDIVDDDGEPVTTLVRPRSCNRLKKVTSHGNDDMEAAILSVLNDEPTHEMPSPRLREEVLHMLHKPVRPPAKLPEGASNEEQLQHERKYRDYNNVKKRWQRSIDNLFKAGTIDKPKARRGNIKLLSETP